MFPLREEGNLPLQGLLSDLLRLTHDGHGVDVEVELVGREAPPAAGAVLQPELGEVGGAKVADSAKHLSCSLSSSGKKNKFGYCTADSQIDADRHQMYNNGTLVLFSTACVLYSFPDARVPPRRNQETLNST